MTCLTNARIVLRDRMLHGTIVMDGSVIASVEEGVSHVPGAIDMDGDLVIPGVVDLHTDNLERQVQPRSNARWPSRSAMVAHDSQCAAAGVTTVLDALCLGDLGFDKDRIRTFREGVVDGDALSITGLLKSDHLPASALRDAGDGRDRPAGPGGRPSPRAHDQSDGPLARCRPIRQPGPLPHDAGQGGHRSRNHRAPDRGVAGTAGPPARPESARLLDRVRPSGTVLASHDDRTAEEVDENHRDGIRISEFPVAMEAARAAKAHGMQVIAGAPNIVRGGSHSGNVAASDLVRARAVDAFASDYVPASLVEAAFGCVRDTDITLPDAVALVSDRPAQMAGLTDRGRIEAGFRADLVRVRVHDGLPIVRQVWLAGDRVI